MEVRYLTSSIISLIFILSNHQVNADQPNPNFEAHFCVAKENYTDGSEYGTNLQYILSSLPSSAGNGHGFFNLSSGEVYATALCRGDVGPDICRSCLGRAAAALPRLCRNEKEAVLWYDLCMLRYAGRPLYGQLNPNWKNISWDSKNLSSSVDVKAFEQSLESLLNKLKNQAAAAGGPGIKFAAEDELGSGFTRIYAVVQCTPDLSTEDCVNCLDKAFEEIPEWFEGDTSGPEFMKEGARVDGTSCSFRYDTSLFYNLTAGSSHQSSTTTASASKGLRLMVIVFVSSALVVIVVIIISVCVCWRIKRRKKTVILGRPVHEPAENIENTDSLQYSFQTVRVATDDFSEENKLGEGGFGPVYKGRLTDGQEIAVKRLSTGSAQGDLEFKNEVMLLVKLQHRNLVRLLGFCLEGNERILVYEFVPNASLDLFIFDLSKREGFDWERRYKIIAGIARGLLYLHEDSRLRIIHRDLKSSNILLDEEMNPKISDFGLARLFQVDQTHGSTSRIVGTCGYMAPEYALHGHFSVKSDVYSFGVIVLEIVSGRKNSIVSHDDRIEDLLSYAWRQWKDKTALNVVDPLAIHAPGSEVVRYIHIGLLCVQENVAKRPAMDTIILMLNSNSVSLPMPSEPASFLHSSRRTEASIGFDMGVTTSDVSKNESVQASSNEATLVAHLNPR